MERLKDNALLFVSVGGVVAFFCVVFFLCVCMCLFCVYSAEDFSLQTTLFCFVSSLNKLSFYPVRIGLDLEVQTQYTFLHFTLLE